MSSKAALWVRFYRHSAICSEIASSIRQIALSPALRHAVSPNPPQTADKHKTYQECIANWERCGNYMRTAPCDVPHLSSFCKAISQNAQLITPYHVPQLSSYCNAIIQNAQLLTPCDVPQLSSFCNAITENAQLITPSDVPQLS